MGPDDYGRTVKRLGDVTVTTTVKPLYQMAVCSCGQRHHHEAVARVVHTTPTSFGARSTRVESFFNVASDGRCGCGRLLRWRAIAGRKNSTPCSAKCTASKGFVCDCSCGGANHGRGDSD